MPCNGNCVNIAGQTQSCEGGQWSCNCPPVGQWISNGCYWSSGGGGCEYDYCCNWTQYMPGVDPVVGPCTADCPSPCYSCCGGDLAENDPPPCTCYTISTMEVTSGTGNPGSLGDCRSCAGTSGTTTCRNMCDNYCGSHYGTDYSTNECTDGSGDIRGGSGTVYPDRSYYNCANNDCWEHNACSCDCLTPVTETVEVVNGPFIGCTDVAACNHDEEALCDNNSCDYGCYGCTNSGAVNYDSGATVDDGSCEYYEAECIDPAAVNCDPQCSACNMGGTFDCESEGNCEYPIVGCTDESAINYNPDATIACNGNNGGITCDYQTQGECTVGDGYTTESCDYNGICNPTNNYIEEENNQPCNTDCGSCGNFCICVVISDGPGTNCCCDYEEDDEGKPIPGCSDLDALNYNSDATYDDGSCIYDTDDYLCEGTTTCSDYYLVYDECPLQYGCEFIEVGDSESREEGCVGSNISCFNDIFVDTLNCPTALGCEPHNDGGCNDPDAYNYDEDVLYNDGSCIFYPNGETNGDQVTWYCQVWTINNEDFYCRINGYELPNYPWDILISEPNIFQDGSQPDWSMFNGMFISITQQSQEPLLHFENLNGIQYFYQGFDWVSWELVDESVTGCTNQYAYNYNSDANYDDGSCLFYLEDGGENKRFKIEIDVDDQYGLNYREKELLYFKFPRFYEGDNQNFSSGGDVDYEHQIKNNLFDLGSYYTPQYFYTILNSKSTANKLSLLNKFYKTDLGMKVNNQVSNPNRLESEEWDDNDGSHSRNDCESLDYIDNPIKITELMHSPRRITNEYLEIHNTSGTPVDLSGWRFSKGVYFTFPEGTIIPGGEYIVIGRPTPLPCSQEEPLMCQAQCLNAEENVVQEGEEGTCFYYDEFNDGVNHPKSGTECSWENLCDEINFQYLSRPQADIFNNPDDYGAVLGENLFYWNLNTQGGSIINLSDLGEDVRLVDAEDNNIDCIDYKGWTPDAEGGSSYDMLTWPLVRAGIFGGNSLEKFQAYDHFNSAETLPYIWYAGRKFPNIFVLNEDPITDEGTPLSGGLQTPAYLGNYSYNNIDFTSSEAQDIDNWMVSYYPDGEFILSIAMISFIGQTNVCQNESGNDLPCITGMWASRVPGFGIYEITGTFKMTGIDGDWITDIPPEIDDCGIEDGTNDCSNCNAAGGYQCDNCECSGCTDPEALNFGSWFYGTCEESCVGSGNCNTLFNICSGPPNVNSYCETDEDCIWTGFECNYPEGGPNSSMSCTGNGFSPNPDVFGQCIPEDYGGIGDADCIIPDSETAPLFDDGSCEYDEPAGYVEGRIVQQDGGTGKVLQLRTLDTNTYSGGSSGLDDYGKLKSNNVTGFKVQKVQGKLSKLISNAKSTSKQYNNSKTAVLSNDTLITQTQFQSIRENRDSIFIAGVQLYVWSNRCFNNFFDVSSSEGWETMYNLITTSNMNGGKYANIVSYYLTDDDSISPIEITSEWTDVLFFGWSWNVYNSRNISNCGTPGWPDCDTNFIIIGDINGENIECIMEDDSIRFPSSRCHSSGGGEMDLPPSPY